ncbi:MAG: hypothetical protein NTV25_06575, partial [Methanothrix sp.]|nr:hypothetical protein [Methanothrix sp.]
RCQKQPHFKKKQCFIDLREHKKCARVHFIPDLKVGVFVTLRAPEVIKICKEAISAGRRS